MLDSNGILKKDLPCHEPVLIGLENQEQSLWFEPGLAGAQTKYILGHQIVLAMHWLPVTP